MPGGTIDVAAREPEARAPRPRPRAIRAARACTFVLVALLVLGAGGCAYFNTFHHAKKDFAKAQRIQAESKSDKLSPEAVKYYDKAIERSAKVIFEHGGGWRAGIDDALFLMGASFYGKRDDEAAVKKFRELILNYPHSDHVPEALFYTGLCYVRMRNEAAAERTFERVLHDFPDFPRRDEIMFATAQSLEASGATEAALRKYHQLLSEFRKSPKREDALLRVGEIHFEAGRHDSSLTAYQELAATTRDDDRYFEAQLRVGACLVRTGDYDRALDIYRRILPNDLESNEDAGRVWLAMAEAENRRGRYEQALELLGRVTEHFEKRGPGIEAAYVTGYTYETYLRDYAKAREAYTQVTGVSGSSVFKDQAERRLKNLTYLEQLQNSQDAAQADREQRADAALKVAEFTLFEGQDPATALTQYAGVASNFAGTQAAQRAVYARALVYRDLDSLSATIDALAQVVNAYPASTQAARAVDLLGELGEPAAKVDSLRLVVRAASAEKSQADSIAAAAQAAAEAAKADSISALETAGAVSTPTPASGPALADSTSGVVPPFSPISSSADSLKVKKPTLPRSSFVPITIDSMKAAAFADSVARLYRGEATPADSVARLYHGEATPADSVTRPYRGEVAPADSMPRREVSLVDSLPPVALSDSSSVSPLAPDSAAAADTLAPGGQEER